jgi:hypothetical protein
MTDGLLLVQNPMTPGLDAYRLGSGTLAWRVPFPSGYSDLLAVVPGGVLVQAIKRFCPSP